jgi:betaine-aldehyde dehydrogenase
MRVAGGSHDDAFLSRSKLPKNQMDEVTRMHHGQLWIDGTWVDTNGGERMPIENPATRETIAEVINGSYADVDRAVRAAGHAFKDGRWSRLTPGERSIILWRLADLIEGRAAEFARIESQNTGKPLEAEMLSAEMPFIVDNLRFFAAAARDAHGHAAGEYSRGYTSLYSREPVGPVGQIAPWNYPLMLAVWKIGAALAAGCTTVLKPAPATPLTTLMLAELTVEAGIPAGVVNIVTGGNETGQAIVEHPGLRMVSLTGSTLTGKKVMQAAANTLKRVHLELGGKAPFLIFDDADLETVSSMAAFASTVNTGQDCLAATRVYVEEGRVEEATDAIVEAMRAVRVGSPFASDVQVGPLISQAQRERVSGFVERAKASGARVLTGGVIPDHLTEGYYYQPTVIVGAAQDSEIVQSEVFGPVVTIASFRDEHEAVALGNDVLYGLAASVWTSDIGRALRLARELEFGTVWINDHIPLVSEAPHGGFKQSGFGKDLSTEAIADHQITKHVMLKHT